MGFLLNIQERHGRLWGGKGRGGERSRQLFFFCCSKLKERAVFFSTEREIDLLGCKVNHHEREGGGKGSGKCPQLTNRESLPHEALHRK